MLYTYEYDSSYDPSLPVVEITVSAFGRTSEGLTVTAIVDSGADGTIMPLNILHQINARMTGQVNIRGISGVRYTANVYEVTMRIGTHDLPIVRVVGDPQNQESILGRDILNQMIVTLNGPAETTEINQ